MLFQRGQAVILNANASFNRRMDYGYPIFVIDDITFDSIDNAYVYVLSSEDGRHLTAYENELELYYASI